MAEAKGRLVRRCLSHSAAFREIELALTRVPFLTGKLTGDATKERLFNHFLRGEFPQDRAAFVEWLVREGHVPRADDEVLLSLPIPLIASLR